MISQMLINGLIAGSAIGLLAASFALIYQTARFFHFAHASVFTLAAYLTYLFARTAGLPILLAVLTAIALTGFCGSFLYVAVYLPISRRAASPTSLLLVSLGLMVAIQNLIAMLFGDELKTVWDRPVVAGLSVGAALITPVQLLTVAFSAFALILLAGFLKFTPLGLSLRAVADNSEFATVIGIESTRITSAAFAIGSAMAAVSAILASFDTGLTPTMGFNALLMAVVAAVVGGVGSIQGALIGGMGIGLVRNLAAMAIPTAWLDPLVFVILIAFLLIRPHGLLGEPPPRR